MHLFELKIRFDYILESQELLRHDLQRIYPDELIAQNASYLERICNCSGNSCDTNAPHS